MFRAAPPRRSIAFCLTRRLRDLRAQSTPYAESPAEPSSLSCAAALMAAGRADVLPGHHLARILAAGRTVRHGAGSTMGHPHHLLSFTRTIMARSLTCCQEKEEQTVRRRHPAGRI